MNCRHALRWLLMLVIGYAALSAASCSAQTQRKVFAHYMLANLDYVATDAPDEAIVASYQREIRQAQSIGIDGFALNAGGWIREPRYIRRASAMFEAATLLNTGFKLFFSADMCCGNDAADVEDMMRRFANNPRYADTYFHYEGKAVLSTFSGEGRGPEFWQAIRRDLEHGTGGEASSAPLPIFLVPSFFWGGELPEATAISAQLSAYQSVIDGLFYWGIAGVPGLGRSPDQIPSSRAYASALHSAGKFYMAPVCFQFWGANHGRYYEYSGYRGMRAMWMDAIATTHPEWVEIITWNDFIEGTYVSPIDDPARYPRANELGDSVAPAATQHFFPSHRGATDLLAYFIAWYKTDRQPVINKDTVYWAYRTQPLATSASHPGPLKIYGPVADVVYVTANLTAPATLRISFGDKAKSIPLPAGSTDVELPFVAGLIPHFKLERRGRTIASGDGDDIISTHPTFPDFYYSSGSIRH